MGKDPKRPVPENWREREGRGNVRNAVPNAPKDEKTADLA